MLRDLFSFKVNSKKSMKTFSETQRYAKAVYRLAYEAKSLDVLEKDFLNLKEILDQSADLKKFIKNPTYKYSVINNVIDSLAKHFSFSDLFSRFLKVLNKNRRFFFLEKIVNNFFDLFMPRIVKNSLNTIIIKCPNSKCKESFEYQNLFNHLANCKFTEREAICNYCNIKINTKISNIFLIHIFCLVIRCNSVRMGTVFEYKLIISILLT